MHRLSVLVRGAFNGFVPQIVSDKAPNMFHFIEVFELFLVFLCFFCQIARGRRPTLTQTLTLTPLFFFFHTSTFHVLDKPWSQVSSLLPPGSCLQSLSRIGFSDPTARRFFIECLLTHFLALSTGQFVLKKKSQRMYTNMHSAGLELTKLTYTRLEDNLIRHRGDLSASGVPWRMRATPKRCSTA